MCTLTWRLILILIWFWLNIHRSAHQLDPVLYCQGVNLTVYSTSISDTFVVLALYINLKVQTVDLVWGYLRTTLLITSFKLQNVKLFNVNTILMFHSAYLSYNITAINLSVINPTPTHGISLAVKCLRWNICNFNVSQRSFLFGPSFLDSCYIRQLTTCSVTYFS